MLVAHEWKNTIPENKNFNEMQKKKRNEIKRSEEKCHKFYWPIVYHCAKGP